ncbi:MAG: fibronectin type III domain-containing protein [Candidatus Manganitrophus sp. SB1]|nr:fibronectin type III domain-containing protein [Candidatus Manganitrophus morganii]
MIAMLSKPFYIFNPFGRFFVPLFFLLFLLIGGCGGGGDSKGPAAPVESDPAFSMPFPKGMWAPLPDSDLVMTAQAVIDPGTAGERTVDLTVDLSTNRVTGEIEGVPAGPHTVEIRYFINQVQVAAVTLSVDVVPGQNNPAEIAPAAIRYVEAVSDTLFVADAADSSIKMFDRYSTLPGGRVSTSPTRTLQGDRTGIGAPSSGSLFVDSIGGGLYFADAQANSVSIWRNAAAVNGDTPPDLVLKGQATRLLHPTGIAVDPFRNRLYVVNNNGEILIWNDLSSLDGEVPPTAALVASLFAGDHPVFLDVKRDTLYVVDDGGISVFQKLSGLTGEIQSLNSVPTIRIAGRDLSQAGLAGDSIGDLLYISSRDLNGTVYRIAGASAAPEEAEPAATLAGNETGLDQTSAVALASNVFMALNLAGTEIRVWHQADQKSGDASPTQILELDPNASPEALFYVATQNGERDQAEHVLTVQKSGDGGVTSDLPGINCGTTCTTPFPTGSQVTLTAVAETGSTFAGFSGDCTSATTSCTFTLEAYSVVTVAFSDTQAPAAPSNLIASVASATQIDLSWIFSIDNVGTNGYWIERCEGTGCTNFSRINTSLTTDTNFSDTGLASGIVYRYRVQAEDAAGNLSPFSNIATASTLDTVAPSAPTNLTATPASGTQINLSWTASTDNVGVSGYWIERCTGATCTNFARVNTSLVAATIFNNLDLTSAATYRYRVQAADAAGNLSPFSAIVNATTPDTVNPSTPTGLTATVISGTQINLSWNPSTDNVGVTGYQIQRCPGTTSCTTAFTQIGTATGTSFNNTGLTNGTAYRYRVRAVDAAGRLSSFSNIATATTLDTAAPTAPTDLIATPASGTQINLSWTASTDNVGVSGYWIERCTGATCTNFVRVNGTLVIATTFNNTGLTPATTYRYRVQAADAAENLSPFSTVVNATTLDTTPPTISNVVSGSITETGATISWATNEASDSQVEYGTTTSYGNITNLNTAMVTSHTVALSGLSPSTLYHYRVLSKDSAGNLATSGDFTFTTDDTTSPSVPANLNATAESGSQINLSWAASTDTVGVTGYWIERCTGVACTNFARVNASLVGNTTFSNTGLTPATTYRYQVQASDAEGNLSAYSNIAVATTPDTVSPTAPSNLTAAAANSSQINLSWTASTDNIGINGYWIERCQGAGCSNFARVNTSLATVPSYNDTGLTAGTSYSYRVQATDVAGNLSAYSNIASATTPLQVFPLNVTVIGSGIGIVTSDPNGINCKPGCQADFESGTVILMAVPNTGSDFTRWLGCDSVNGTSCTVNMNEAKSVTATFTLQTFSLTVTIGGTGGGTVTSDPIGINCRSTCQADFEAGTVTLTAAPDLGSDISWSGCDSVNEGICTVNMNAAKSVQANFALLGL